MEHLNSSHKLHIRQVIARYEAMSQKGTVSLLEETVFLGMIDYCISEEKLTKALRIVNDAIPQHPFSVDLYLHKAHLLLNQHNIAESLVTVNQVKLFAPLTVEVELLHAELLGLNGKNHEALNMLSEIKPLTSREVRSKVYLLEAQLFENLGQYSKMFDAASRCLALNDANIEGYERMIWATEYSQRFAESVKFHNRLLDRDAYNWRAWLNLGFAQEALDNNNEAIEAFEYAIAIDDKCRAAYMEAGELLLHIGNYTRAQYIFEMAIFNTGEDSVVLQKPNF